MTEQPQTHTRLLKCGLALEPARIWWQRWTPDATPTRAFSELWFGSASEARVRVLFVNLRARFPHDRVAVLQALRGLSAQDRAWIGLWHLMLADPLVRGAVGTYVHDRRTQGYRDVRREGLVDWIQATHPDRWSPKTVHQFASKLMGVLQQVGLVQGIRGPRPLAVPPLSDRALSYLLYLLRESGVDGELDDNPYLRSLGLPPDDLLARLSTLAGVRYRRVGDVGQFEWTHASAHDWAREAA